MFACETLRRVLSLARACATRCAASQVLAPVFLPRTAERSVGQTEGKYELGRARCSQQCTAGVGKRRQWDVCNLLMPRQARHMHLALLTVGEAEAQMFLRGFCWLLFFFFFSPLSVGSHVSDKRAHTHAKHSLHYFILPSLPVPVLTDTKSTAR